MPILAATFLVNDLFDDPDANPGDGVWVCPLTVDVYHNHIGEREGFRTFTGLYCDQAANTPKSFTFEPPEMAGFIVLMARDDEANSSELGLVQAYTVSPPPDEMFSDRFEQP